MLSGVSHGYNPVYCEQPASVNGSVEFSGTREGSVATYQCDPGFTPEEPVTAVCVEALQRQHLPSSSAAAREQASSRKWAGLLVVMELANIIIIVVVDPSLQNEGKVKWGDLGHSFLYT